MRDLLVLSFVLFPLLTFSITQTEESQYASYYADQLIQQFDSELEINANMMDSDTYMRLLGARIYLEERPQINSKIDQTKINSVSSEGYISVIQEIELLARKIRFEKTWEKFTNPPVLHIYPSSGRDGNLTGNTYPRGVWSLTFDDGPKEGPTEEILEHLHTANMKASFFVLLRQTNRYPESLNRILDQGHELALHSYNHKDLNRVDEKTMKYEVGQALNELQQLRPVELFRLPYGSGLRNTTLRSVITQNKLIHVFWNVDTLDWKDKSPESIFKRTIKQMQKTRNKSGIILFHDIHPQTVMASKMVMEYLNQENLISCPVGEVVLKLNGKVSSCLK